MIQQCEKRKYVEEMEVELDRRRSITKISGRNSVHNANDGRTGRTLWRAIQASFERIKKGIEAFAHSYRVREKPVDRNGRKEMRINIAVDQAVSKKRVEKLKELGYNVVCRANHGEADQDWMKRANKLNALFAISPDADIPRLIEIKAYRMGWINWPQDQVINDRTLDLVAYVDRAIRLKMQFYSEVAQEYMEEK